MADLRKRFGGLVLAYRRQRGMTQLQLADASGLSSTMIGRIEAGSTGARFPSIERIAKALDVDPAQLFSTDPVPGKRPRQPLQELTVKLARLSDQELAWADKLLDAALSPRS